MPKIIQESFEIETLKGLLGRVRKVEGDLAEVGVYQGGTAKIIREMIPDKPLYLFDTFCGLPDTLIPEDIKHKQYVGGCATDESFVTDLLKDYSNVKIVKGIFPQTSDIIKDKRFSFCHLDTDIYKSTLDGLEFFFPRMNKNGIILIHDYPHHPGVMKAADEFLKGKNVDLVQSGIRQLIITIL